MRIVGDIPHPVYKITILHHMNKFTLQIEAEALTQSYQVRESDEIQSAQDIVHQVDQEFLREVDKMFLLQGDNLMKLTSTSKNNQMDELIDGII